MVYLFLALIILCSVLLGLIILIQNPKGGGLAGNIAGFSNQFMGVKQTTDVLEKGTWVFAAIIGALCLFSTFFLKGGADAQFLKDINTNQPVEQTIPVPEGITNPLEQPENLTPLPNQEQTQPEATQP